MVKLGDKITLRVNENDWNLEIIHDKGVIKTTNAPRWVMKHTTQAVEL